MANLTTSVQPGAPPTPTATPLRPCEASTGTTTVGTGETAASCSPRDPSAWPWNVPTLWVPMTTDSNADASDASTSIGRPDGDRRRDLDRARPLAGELQLAHGDALGRGSELVEVAFADRTPLVVDDDQHHDAGADAPRPLERPGDGRAARERTVDPDEDPAGHARPPPRVGRRSPGHGMNGSSLPVVHDGSRAIGPARGAPSGPSWAPNGGGSLPTSPGAEVT